MHQAVPVALETEDLGEAMKAFLSGWMPMEERMDERGEEDKKRNRRTAERSLSHFIHSRKGNKSLYKLTPPPEGGIPVDSRDSEYEVPWAIDIGLRVPLVGRFDGFCVHRDTGKNWIWELKTTSYLNAAFFDAHEMYPQNLTYSLVGQTMLDEPVEGVMLEGMLVSASKVDNITQPIPVTPHHLQDNLEWMQRTGKELLEAEDALAAGATLQEVFPKDFCACTPYPHYYRPGFRCDFADLCRVPDWRALTGLFKVVPDHDFLNVTVDPNATRKVGTTQ
jgi:hypothetical protein